MTLAFLCHLWEHLPGSAALVCTGGRALETRERRGKMMLVISRNPVTFCRESQRERIYLEMGVPIALMLFKWDTIHLVNKGLYIYQILWTFCNITLMSIWNVLPYIQLGKPLPGWGHQSLFWFYIMSFFFCGPSSTENFLGWLLGDSKTSLFLYLHCEMLLSSIDAAPSKCSSSINTLLYQKNTVSDSLPAYPCSGSVSLLHVLCTGQVCNSGTRLLFFSSNASSCFLPSVPHSILHRFYALGYKIQHWFFDEKEMAPVVSFIWKEKSPIIEKLVTSKVTLLNAQCNNRLAQGQRLYLEHMLWVGKPLTLR